MDELPQRLKPGDVLGGRYRIEALIGQGGMSTVYLAEDMRLPGKKRAVKQSRQEEGARASLAEANMLVKLNHPNLPDIVDYYGAEREGRFNYLVMDYIEGETLLQRFERQGRRMPASQVSEYALQLCDVLDYLHGHLQDPIIYRDLKPSNLMIDVHERLWLIDFGIARSYRIGQDADTVPIGTIGFAAPEQFAGRQTDARTDLYGLGALMYYLMSGGQYRHAAGKHLRELDAGLPLGLAELVEKLLQAEPDSRCQSAAEVRGELQRLLTEQRAQDSRRGERQPLLVAVGALYAGAGATFAALALARALHGLGVPHALVEPPKQQPELYALLFGEKHAPAGYRCYTEAAGEPALREAAWGGGGTRGGAGPPPPGAGRAPAPPAPAPPGVV
ncbi:serine/threonine protein kinase [Paenibacillus sp. NPDC056579]|uniref:serine/threonine protein kinase n=1 Tax=Paenibacillus sp. NPDC056579 TaxID=3345871 RepID=UPI003690B55B